MIKRVFTQVFAVVGAILEKDGKVLLVRENKTSARGLWNQPAGWPDVGEDLIASVRREVKEETGFDFQPTGLVGVYSLVKGPDARVEATRHAVKLIFRGTFGGQALASNEEIQEVKWFAPEEIYAWDSSTLRDLDIKQEVKDYFAGKNYPLEIIRHTLSK